jgi:hypothetical protein
LVEGVSLESANIVFDKAVQKVIKDIIKHARLVSTALYFIGIVPFIVIFVVFNDKILSYNNIC